MMNNDDDERKTTANSIVHLDISGEGNLKDTYRRSPPVHDIFYAHSAGYEKWWQFNVNASDI